jgi:two-component sensor histidine kinase
LGALCQNPSEIDSLTIVVKTSKNDSLVMDAYNKLRRATYYSDAEASKGYTQKYLEYAQKRKDSHNIVLAHFFLGNANVLSGNYDKALNGYLIAANYYEQKKDSARLTSVLNSMGAVHEKTKNDSLSLYYYNQARTLGKSLKDYRRSGIASVNIGNILNNQGNVDKAIVYLEDAVKDLETNESFQSFLILAKLNLASALGKKKRYTEALQLYNFVLQNLDTVNDIYNHGNVLRGKSNILLLQGNANAALPFAQKAYKKFTENNFADERFQMMPDLIDIYKATGRNLDAVTTYEEYIVVKDSLLSAEQDKNIADAIQKYETEKKDAQLKVLTLEGEKAEQQKRLYLFLAFGGILIAGLIGFFLYKNRKKNKLLAKQKKLLEATIDEKNVLLKETHHRVKNSFQIVSSLLYLQSENIEDKEAKLAMKEAQNRVRSMVLIHQKLYSKDQLVGINTKEYFTDLTHDIFESHQFEENSIKYTLEVEDMVLDIETITPLGLILNELITNVLKHAFHPVNEKSMMEIRFKKLGEILQLQVEDNGVGMPLEIKESSFGIQLIKALAKKLKATLYFQSANSTGTIAILEMHRFTEL